MVASTQEYIGAGLYTVSEAALYARIPPQTLSRWLFGSRTQERVVRTQFAEDAEKRVSFLDFVQGLAIRCIRLQYKVPLRKIAEAIRVIEIDYHIDYPFARKHTTYLFDGDIHIDTEVDGDLIQVTGKTKHQRSMRPIVELYMKDLSFGADGLAHRYVAYRYGSHTIAMDPLYRFGEPIVESCGYTAQTLWEACEIEGSFEAAAQAFGIETKDVEVAYRYYDHLQTRFAS